jgi:cytoskeleton protein RodZ
MPDIGTTLREARMRQRLDISDIESETKIRAKYLRALENEEWDLLPGPTFVKSFLRTYADALGLDGKLLIEEYKLRHERLSDVELQPIAPLGQRDRRRPSRTVPRGWLVAFVVVGLIAALYALGRNDHNDNGGGGGGGNSAQTTPPTTSGTGGTAAGTSSSSSSKKKKAKAKPKHAQLTVLATGQVYVCLKAAGKRTPINGVILTGGAHQGPFKSSRFRVQLGTSEARLVVNGKSHPVAAASNGVAYEITPTKIRRLQNRSSWPVCRPSA